MPVHHLDTHRNGFASWQRGRQAGVIFTAVLPWQTKTTALQDMLHQSILCQPHAPLESHKDRTDSKPFLCRNLCCTVKQWQPKCAGPARPAV